MPKTISLTDGSLLAYDINISVGGSICFVVSVQTGEFVCIIEFLMKVLVEHDRNITETLKVQFIHYTGVPVLDCVVLYKCFCIFSNFVTLHPEASMFFYWDFISDSGEKRIHCFQKFCK